MVVISPTSPLPPLGATNTLLPTGKRVRGIRQHLLSYMGENTVRASVLDNFVLPRRRSSDACTKTTTSPPPIAVRKGGQLCGGTL